MDNNEMNPVNENNVPETDNVNVNTDAPAEVIAAEEKSPEQVRPKPLRKLVRVNRSEAPQGQYQPQHEAPQGQYQPQHEAPQGQYQPQHEAPQGQYQPQHEAPQPYRPKHDRSVDDYMSRYNGMDDYTYSLPEKDEHKLQNILVKIGAIVVSLVIIGTLVLNMPICVDRKTDKNASIIYLLKHWTPANKEGELDKTEISNALVSQITSEEDYNDGLDLPQLIEGQYSVLFLGFEPDNFNTDIMWVLQFDIGHGGLNILQIPRDCCLPDYTSSPTRKFNSIYSQGNPNINPPIQRTVNAVQENFGIPIDAYVTVTCPDIVEIIDIIGGVPMHLDHEIDFEPSAPGTQFIPAGDIVLSGQQSEWFMRYRSGWAQGDIGRMQNQRRFMAAAMRKLMNIVEDEGRLKLYSYIREIFNKDLLYTDMSLDDMSKLADFASTISMEDARVNMVPGEDAWFYAEDGEKYSVYSVHKRATIDLLNEYYRPYQRNMLWDETTIVELVLNHEYDILDDTSETLGDLEGAAEPIRKPIE